MADNRMAEWMRTERVRVRESQDDVAKAIGKSRSWVATVERGETSDRVRVEDCVLIAEHFGATLRAVLDTAGYTPNEIAGITAADVAIGDVLALVGDELTIRPEALERLVQAATDRAIRSVLESLGLVGGGRGGPPQTPRGLPVADAPADVSPGPRSAPGHAGKGGASGHRQSSKPRVSDAGSASRSTSHGASSRH